MSEIKLSIFASAVRPHLWKAFLDSLKGGKYPYEVIFAGFIDPELSEPFTSQYPEFKYIQTQNIKPAQCYEVARRACNGELVLWSADDCRFSAGFVDKVVDYWWSLNNIKAIISCKTNENNQNETMQNHRFFGCNQNTPLMAPLGIMSRQYLQLLGGYDRRYISGQGENDFCLRVLADGGKVYLYEDVCIDIDHKNLHGSNTEFWSGYNEDRETLENSWVIGGYKPIPKPLLILQNHEAPYYYHPINNREVTLKRNDKFVPFEDKDLLNVSQEPKGIWE